MTDVRADAEPEERTRIALQGKLDRGRKAGVDELVEVATFENRTELGSIGRPTKTQRVRTPTRIDRDPGERPLIEPRLEQLHVPREVLSYTPAGALLTQLAEDPSRRHELAK